MGREKIMGGGWEWKQHLREDDNGRAGVPAPLYSRLVQPLVGRQLAQGAGLRLRSQRGSGQQCLQGAPPSAPLPACRCQPGRCCRKVLSSSWQGRRSCGRLGRLIRGCPPAGRTAECLNMAGIGELHTRQARPLYRSFRIKASPHPRPSTSTAQPVLDGLHGERSRYSNTRRGTS